MTKKETPKKTKKREKGGGGALLLSVALGAALAAGAGYYATHKEEVDKEAKKRIDELAKLFAESRRQIEPKVREVWGVVSRESVEKYIDLRAALLKALEDERVKNAGVIVKENYDAIVESVVAKAKKSGMLDAATQRKLEKLFKTDWNVVKEVMVTGAEVAAAVTKKGINKAKKEVKKMSKQMKAKKPIKKTVNKAVKKTGTKKAVKKATKPVKKAVKKIAKKSKKK